MPAGELAGYRLREQTPCGDYGLAVDGRLVAAVERKSLPDVVSSLINGTLRYALGELPHSPCRRGGRGPLLAGVQTRLGPPSMIADGLAELQVRWPGVPIVFCETRQLAEEWTYR